MFTRIRQAWARFEEKRPGTVQFILFTVISQGMTVLQLVLMPVFRALFSGTSLVQTDFQVLPLSTNPDGSPYYLFDYGAGELPAGGGGLAYFLAVQLTLAIAQVINFFLQRNVAFKSNSNAWIAAGWYVIAYIAITFIAAAAQGFYKTPIYTFFIDTLGWGAAGETTADVITMIINACISFWIFFPIFKIIFTREPEEAEEAAEAAGGDAPDALADGSAETAASAVVVQLIDSEDVGASSGARETRSVD